MVLTSYQYISALLKIAKLSVPSGLRPKWRRASSSQEPEEVEVVGGLKDEDAEAEKPTSTPFKWKSGRNRMRANEVC
jgi:hypothetical protein